MNCELVQVLLADLAIDGDSGRGDAAIRGHLRNCSGCVDALERERNVMTLLREWSEPEVRDRDRERFLSSVRAAVSAEPRRGRRLVSVSRAAVAASVAAVALLLGAAAIGRMNGPSESVATVGPETGPDDTEPGMFTMVGPFSERERVEAKRTGDRSRRAEPKPRRGVRKVSAPRPAPTVSAFGLGPSDSDSMMRFEFQTEDPTIRIIWFVPRAGEVPSDRTEIGD